MGKESGNEESDNQTKNIVQMCNALLNSGGGVLEMKISDPQKAVLDRFWKPIEQELIKMLLSLTYNDFFDRIEPPCKTKVLVFINAPNRFCTMNYNLFVPGDSSVQETTFDKVVDLLNSDGEIQVPLEKLPKVPDSFSDQAEISMNERKQVQFKCYKSLLFSQPKHRFTIAKQLSAFGNGDGGVILIGITDNKIVSGVDMKKNSKECVVKSVTSLVNDMYCNFELKKGIHWDLTFSDVTESKSVIVIKMAGFGNFGGIFGKCPKGYELRRIQNGLLVPQSLSFNEWKERMKPDDSDLTGNNRGVY